MAEHGMASGRGGDDGSIETLSRGEVVNPPLSRAAGADDCPPHAPRIGRQAAVPPHQPILPQTRKQRELVAAWLWERHGNEAMLTAMHWKFMPVFRQLIEVQRAVVHALRNDVYGLLHLASNPSGKLEYITFTC